jgi:transposase
VTAFFKQQEPRRVVLEACGAAHHSARIASGLGHDVKLIAPEPVRPFVKKCTKNDAADAAVLCTAASQPDKMARGRCFGPQDPGPEA